MKALHFESRLRGDGTLPVPTDVAAQLPKDLPVRVVLLLEDPAEPDAWAALTADEFLAGYDEGDAIYDAIPPG